MIGHHDDVPRNFLRLETIGHPACLAPDEVCREIRRCAVRGIRGLTRIAPASVVGVLGHDIDVVPSLTVGPPLEPALLDLASVHWNAAYRRRLAREIRPHILVYFLDYVAGPAKLPGMLRLAIRQRTLSRSSINKCEILWMTLAESVGIAEMVRPVAARNVRCLASVAVILQHTLRVGRAICEDAQRLRVFSVPERRIPARKVVCRGFGDASFGDVQRLAARRNRSELSRKIEPASREPLKEFIDAEKRATPVHLGPDAAAQDRLLGIGHCVVPPRNDDSGTNVNHECVPLQPRHVDTGRSAGL